MEVFSNFTVFTSTDEENSSELCIIHQIYQKFPLQYLPRHKMRSVKNEELNCSMQWRLDVITPSKVNESYDLSVFCILLLCLTV